MCKHDEIWIRNTADIQYCLEVENNISKLSSVKNYLNNYMVILSK